MILLPILGFACQTLFIWQYNIDGTPADKLCEILIKSGSW